MDPKSFIHEHPLEFFEEWGERLDGYEYLFISVWERHSGAEDIDEHVPCSVCQQPVSTQLYACIDCKFFIHKSCYDQLQLNITHLFHPNHALSLLKEAPKNDGRNNRHGKCNFCHYFIEGFHYNCRSCEFDLHIQCAFLPQFTAGDLPKHKLFIHKHQLVLIENLSGAVKLNSSCSACSKELLGTCFYTCPDCKFLIHKSCSEPPLEIKHPFHDKHLLNLLPNPLDIEPQPVCNFCKFQIPEFECFYKCHCCRFNLHIKCAFLQQILAGDFSILDHFSHEHQLISIEKLSDQVDRAFCPVCGDWSQGPFYCCLELDCKFHLDKKCAEFPSEINHPFHCFNDMLHEINHPFHCFNDKLHFTVLLKPPYPRCPLCDNFVEGFAYQCLSCHFICHVKCALLLSQFTDFDENHLPKLYFFSHLHEHKLVFIEKHSNELTQIECGACSNKLSDSIYSCLRCKFYLHKKCAEFPTEINHPSHRRHPLTLEFHTLFCDLCLPSEEPKEENIGFECSSCPFYIQNECASPPRTIENKNHPHPFALFWRDCPSTCDACGEDDGYARYLCLTCNLMVHEKCISLPLTIKISVHAHPIRHTYFSEQKGSEMRNCRICHKQVKAEYGSYYCLDLDCNCIFHVNCALKRGCIVIESENEASSSSCAGLGENIKHFSHKHELVFSEGIMDEKWCDGCALPILSSAYNCSQPWCNFSLHKTCAQIQKEEKHWDLGCSHRVRFRSFVCTYCEYLCKGFDFYFGHREICLRCYKLPFEITHEGHGHQLCLNVDHDYAHCSACGKGRYTHDYPYRCTEEGCNFFLDRRCLTRPLKARHKFDEHPLKLTYEDPNKDDDPLQHICWICEDRRDPKLWFYRCDECDFDAHPECVLGEYPFIKRGSFYTDGRIDHPHPLTYFQCEKYPYPKCDDCGEPCKDLAIKCTKSNCNFALHLTCARMLWKLRTVWVIEDEVDFGV